MGLFKDEAPLLSKDSAIDEGVGIEVGIGSKLVGSWSEVFQAPIATAAVNQSFYIAPYPVEVVSFNAVWAVASTSGTIMLEKSTGTQAPASGTNVLTGTISSAGAANTVTAGTLTTTRTTLQLATG